MGMHWLFCVTTDAECLVIFCSVIVFLPVQHHHARHAAARHRVQAGLAEQHLVGQGGTLRKVRG